MTFDQIKTLLAMAAARDNRTPSQASAMAWNQDLGDLNYADCVEAMNRHYRLSEPVWITPQHIRSRVRDIQEERRRGTSEPLALAKYAPPPAEQRAINARGRELINRAIGGGKDEDTCLDPDDPVRDAALRRARADKRDRERQKAVNPDMARLVSQATRHIERP